MDYRNWRIITNAGYAANEPDYTSMNEHPMISKHYPVPEGANGHHRQGHAGRIKWFALLLPLGVVIATLPARAWLIDAKASSADGKVQVHYKRLSRSASPGELSINVKGAPSKPVWVQLGGSMLQEASIETVRPQPLRMQTQGKAMLVEVATDEAGMATVHLTVRNKALGQVTGHVRAGANSAVRLSTFLYP
ncbi:hypothetical protein IRZ53_13885 [Pseudomonas fulva]|uniref:hypothetical protein n=1 Tax=Pseudomonas fulva TaxID=47880 RepID=UPI0018AB27CF|nr:hypothetical protein [Pseudomonas fulva]MBF8675810.1 hypothetical protein [Pseudomonas fulva]MBF8697881.1 hypothetical protein [Pseudomonas fulva]